MSLADTGGNGLHSVIDRLEIGIAVLDRETRVIHWNRWLAARSGIEPGRAADRPLSDVLPETVGTRLEMAVDQAIRNHLPALLSPALHGTLLPLFQTADERRLNRRMHQLIHVLPVDDPQQSAACIIQINDMTATVSRERVLRQQAEHLRRSTHQDPLTGLANRRLFDETLAGEFAKAQGSGQPLALVIADLDHFSDFNTLYGREKGDATLREIGKACQAALRPYGDLAARYNGDEFAFILPNLTAEAARPFAENLRVRIQTLNIANEASETASKVTASLGLAVFVPSHEADTNTLLSAAEIALYQAKHEGRNRAVSFSLDDGSFRICG